MKKLVELKKMFGLLFVEVVIDEHGIPKPAEKVTDVSEGWSFYVIPNVAETDLQEKLKELHEINNKGGVIMNQYHDGNIYLSVENDNFPQGTKIEV